MEDTGAAVVASPPRRPRPIDGAVPRVLSFLPGDPPRQGTFVAYPRPAGMRTGNGSGEAMELEVVVATGRSASVRRRIVPAQPIGIAEALAALDGGLEGAAIWSAVLSAGLGLIARGRLYPTVTTTGADAWRAGPLDAADRRLLAELAAALPPAAHALVVPGSSPLRIRSAAGLIQACWDALADTLPRTAAAPLIVANGAASAAPFAALAPVACAELAPWLVDAAGGLVDETGADVALRIELDPLAGPAPSVRQALDDQGDGAAHQKTSGREGEDNAGLVGRAVLQLTSRAEASLVVDAAELYRAPAAVVARFGDDAETDLLRALRRGARAWPPLEALLHERAPTGLDLDEDRLAELLSEGTARFQGTGISLLWPSDILAEGIELRAAVVAAPGVVTEAGFGLDQLVEFTWQATLGGELLSAEEIDQLAEAKRGLVRLRGRFIAVDAALLERLRAKRRRLSAAEALGSLLAGTLDLDGESVPVVADGPLAGLAERLGALRAAPGDLGVPKGLASGVALRPYQARGVAWLDAMCEAGLGGCLADDMGLGKTLQVIALHLHRAARGRGPTLVICPTSLLGNWEREIRRFAPDTAVRRHHGTARDLQDLAVGEIVVTSYGIARRDAEALGAAGFGLVVADEAQHAKNPATATARALRAIGAPVRLALSGTPVENRLSELWSILDWTMPGLLGPFERFVRNVATPIERERDPLVTERLAKTVMPFVLRRKKTDPEVAPDLPARIVSDVPVPLTSEQVTLYEAEVREALEAIATKDGIARQGLVLRMLTVLKQICNHPAQYLHQRGPLAGRSGKLAALEELIDVIVAEGESVLVFSQYVECLALIEARLSELGVASLLFHGGVAAKRRGEIVADFQAGKAPVLLLSLKAGGVGLNLTRATHVVHFDRWWNPAVEDQATDRAHRIGQARRVQVHRLIAEGTLEDRVGQLIEQKRALAEAVVGGGETFLGQLSNEELADLVQLGSGA